MVPVKTQGKCLWIVFPENKQGLVITIIMRLSWEFSCNSLQEYTGITKTEDAWIQHIPILQWTQTTVIGYYKHQPSTPLYMSASPYTSLARMSTYSLYTGYIHWSSACTGAVTFLLDAWYPESSITLTDRECKETRPIPPSQVLSSALSNTDSTDNRRVGYGQDSLPPISRKSIV